MREIIYEYHNRGVYETSDNTVFGEDKELKIILKPHQFSIEISNEVLRKSSCDGYEIIVSNNGEAVFYNSEGNVIAKIEESNENYKEVRVFFKNNTFSIQFGFVDIVDHYPNCDGEYDRYSERWTPERKIDLNPNDNSIKLQ